MNQGSDPNQFEEPGTVSAARHYPSRRSDRKQIRYGHHPHSANPASDQIRQAVEQGLDSRRAFVQATTGEQTPPQVLGEHQSLPAEAAAANPGVLPGEPSLDGPGASGNRNLEANQPNLPSDYALQSGDLAAASPVHSDSYLQPTVSDGSTSDASDNELIDYWSEDLAGLEEMHPGGPLPLSSHARAKRRARKRKRRLITLLVVTVLGAVVLAGAAVAINSLGGVSSFFSSNTEDYEGEGSGSVYVEIPSGATGTQIGQILEENEVIKSADAFVDAFKQNSLAEGIQAGRFEMRKHMSAKAALSRLLDPEARADLVVTIPEGFTVEQIKARLIKASGFSEQDVEAAFSDPSVYGISATGENAFEGWLGASSYTIDSQTQVKDLVQQMVDYQMNILDEAGVATDQRETILTKASIIEREVNQSEYYAKVSQVIDNRLAENSPTNGLLQMDSTVLYGLNKTGGIPTKDDLKTDTPYNTYLHAGLPPTPIGSPGAEAIKAAQNPEPGSWIYFTTVNLDTGETKFATSYEEHAANVEELKQWCSIEENKEKC